MKELRKSHNLKTKNMNNEDIKLHYILEPIIASELTLVNNAKRLKENPDLYNDENLEEIESLRREIKELERRTLRGEKGLLKVKFQKKNMLRELSVKTFVPRDMEYFMSMAIEIVNKLATSPKFAGYTFLDEMKSLALEHIFKYSHNFDANKISPRTGKYPSAFAYITTIAMRAFLVTINNFKKEQENLREYYEKFKIGGQELEEKIEDEKPEYENLDYKVICIDDLKEGELIKRMKKITLHSPVCFIIPKNYRITEKDHSYITKYEYGISIKRHEGNCENCENCGNVKKD